MMLWLWILSLVAVVAVCVITAHDTYELRRRLQHSKSAHQQRVIIARLVVLWIASVTSLLAALLGNIDNQKKEERFVNLSRRLTPVISQAVHDRFVRDLRDAPKGTVPVLHEEASVATYEFIAQIRKMLTDAGYKTNDFEASDKVDLDVDSEGGVKTDVLLLVKSKNMADNPPYAEALSQAFARAGLAADFYVVNQNLPALDNSRLAVLVLNTQ